MNNRSNQEEHSMIAKSLASSLAAFATLALTTAAFAEDNWPPPQMTIVVSHDVGSSHNAQTRALGEVWAEKLGTKFIYENRDGASGRVGYDYFLGQKKDGSVILSSNLGSSSIMYIQQKPKWKYEEVIYPVGSFGIDPGAIFVKDDSPFKSMTDVIEAAKKRPVTMGISFWASPENLQIHQAMEQTGAKFEIIPHSNSGEITTQVLGGHLEVGYSKVGTFTRGGNGLRIISVPMPTNPVPALTSNAPPFDKEIGTDTLPIASYRGILVHKEFADAHPDRVQKLHDTLTEALKDPRVVEAMKKTGVDENLLVNMTHDEIMKDVIQAHWTAFDKYGSIYDKKTN